MKFGLNSFWVTIILPSNSDLDLLFSIGEKKNKKFLKSRKTKRKQKAMYR